MHEHELPHQWRRSPFNAQNFVGMKFPIVATIAQNRGTNRYIRSL
ncbi:hypothetical protein [Laspinema palackyanum]